jgi:hypothetical protein
MGRLDRRWKITLAAPLVGLMLVEVALRMAAASLVRMRDLVQLADGVAPTT